MEIPGINGYTAIREYQNNAMKKDLAMRRKRIILRLSQMLFRNTLTLKKKARDPRPGLLPLCMSSFCCSNRINIDESE